MRLFRFMLNYSRTSLLLAILAGAISGACNAALLAIANSALGAKTSPTASNLLAMFVVLCVAAPVARSLAEFLLIHLGQGAIFHLRVDLCRQILRLPLRRLEISGPSRLLAVLTEDVPNITNLIGSIPVLMVNLAVVLTTLFYMYRLNGYILLLVLGVMATGVATYQYVVGRAFRHLRLAREEHDRLHSLIASLLSGIKELKMHVRRRTDFLSMLAGSARKLRQHNQHGLAVYTFAASWGQLLVFAAIGALVFGSGWIGGVDMRVRTGFTLCLLYLSGPLQMIMNAIPALARANVSLRSVEDLGLMLAAQPSDLASAGALPADSSLKSLEFVNTTCGYDREDAMGRFVLGPLNISFAAGEIVFISGGNGSGKTTFAKLLTGLYAPETGEIRVNGRAVAEEDRDAYRQQFSTVFSDFHLFDSLIGLDPQSLDEKASTYLARLRLEHKVTVRDGLLSTIELSQGQRKRLALLTSYLEDRPIYLFDEWAADQDSAFRDIFYREILSELKAKGKTLFVISHDDRYYPLADRIVKFDSGELVFDSGAFAAGSLVRASAANQER